MKRKEINDLKQKPVGELEARLREDKKKLHQLRFDLLAGKVKNVSSIHEVKKDIARVLTFLKEKK